MSIKIGDVHVSNEIIELHFQVLRTQLVLDKLIQDVDFDTKSIDAETLRIVKERFPNMGIRFKGEKIENQCKCGILQRLLKKIWD